MARYIGSYGSKGVRSAVFISSIQPFVLKTPENPEGVDGSVFEAHHKAIAADRYAFLSAFLKNLYNADLLLGKRISDQALQASGNIAAASSAIASVACAPAILEDFRQDLARIDVFALCRSQPRDCGRRS